MSIGSVMLSNHLIICLPLLLLPSIFPSIRVFSNESVLHIRWPKYWSFSFSISPCNEYLGPISFRIDRFDLLEVQGTLRSLLQHHSSKASILQCSAFFIVQLSLSWVYVPTSQLITSQVTFWLWQVKPSHVTRPRPEMPGTKSLAEGGLMNNPVEGWRFLGGWIIHSIPLDSSEDKLISKKWKGKTLGSFSCTV